MKDMQQGVDIVLDAIDEGKKIVVYGDYDADGVTSTSILYKGLLEIDANVEYYIPDREAEGYGMSSNRLKILKEQGAEVILTCDNGISAVEEVKFAKELGMQVVVTDHHELPFKEEDGERKYIIPEADAVINPKRNDCNYPFKMLCGAGIAFKFIQALYVSLGLDDSDAYKFIEIAGIGTICDVVDLVSENRIIAKNALKMMKSTSNLGLQCLMNALGINKEEIKSYNIGFMIGPCINATGRLDTAALSVELLITKDEERAKELANILYDLNKTRQEMTTRNVEEIIDVVENSSYRQDRKSTRLNSSHANISYAVFCLKKKKGNGLSSRMRVPSPAGSTTHTCAAATPRISSPGSSTRPSRRRAGWGLRARPSRVEGEMP